MTKLDIQNHIKFTTKILNSGDTYQIKGIEIIIVISGEIEDRIKGKLKFFESSIYYRGEVKAKKKTLITVVSLDSNEIVLNKVDVNKEFGEYCRKIWKQLRDLYDVEGFEKIDLYRSDKIEQEFEGVKYNFNFWFCGPDTDCLLHNVHDFIEIHTCIAGDGFMQKFDGNNEENLVETVGLMPGSSHRTFNIDREIEEKGNPKYPFHRWLGGKTGNIWLAIEKY
ncbi:MAG: hypothetical protein WC850_04255 [Candidatus Gracilibacteria bacterium]